MVLSFIPILCDPFAMIRLDCYKLEIQFNYLRVYLIFGFNVFSWLRLELLQCHISITEAVIWGCVRSQWLLAVAHLVVICVPWRALLLNAIVDVAKGHVKVLGGEVAVVHRHGTANIQALIVCIAGLLIRFATASLQRPWEAVGVGIVTATTCHFQVLHWNAISLQTLLVVAFGLKVNRVVHVVLVPMVWVVLVQHHWVLEASVGVVWIRYVEVTSCCSYPYVV